MRCLKKTLCGFLAFCCLKLTAQDIRKLKKGELLPDLPVQTYKGAERKTFSLSSLKGKVVLLDFWGINCLECIAALPKMVELQEQFGDSLQILLVTKNSRQQVDALFRKFEGSSKGRNWVNAGRQLPFVFEDSVFWKLFPYNGLPTHVWINRELRYYGTAYARSATAANIRALVHDQNPELAGKYLVDFDLKDPASWLDPEKNLTGQLKGLSVFMGHLQLGRSYNKVWYRRDSSGNITGISCVNNPLMMLYQWAYRDHPSPYRDILTEERIVIESDNWQFKKPAEADYFAWTADHTYTYALQLPEGIRGNVHQIMRRQLDDYFDLDSRMEKRKLKSLVLKRIWDSSRFISKDVEILNGTQKTNGKLFLYLQNRRVGELYMYLLDVAQGYKPEIPLVDETNYKGLVTLQLPWKEDAKSIRLEEIRPALQAQGFDLVVEERLLDVLVIKDRLR